MIQWMRQTVAEGKEKDMVLDHKGEDVSRAYENLDGLSEEYIAFCKSGKWRYLKVERE